MPTSRAKIDALINLLEDPDDTIFHHIREEIKSLGSDIIPNLEDYWLHNRRNLLFQQRLEGLIREIQFDSFEAGLLNWWYGKNHDLLEGVVRVARYRYPELEPEDIRNKLEPLVREIWLELNDHLTALEKIRVINHFLFETHRFRGNAANYHDPKNSFINDVIDMRKGNPLSLSIVYLLICQSLDLPVLGVNLPRHFIVAFLDPTTHFQEGDDPSILFYINPYSGGSVFGHQELNEFLKKIHLEPQPSFFVPCSNQDIVSRLLNNLSYAYARKHDKERAAELDSVRKRLT